MMIKLSYNKLEQLNVIKWKELQFILNNEYGFFYIYLKEFCKEENIKCVLDINSLK